MPEELCKSAADEVARKKKLLGTIVYVIVFPFPLLSYFSSLFIVIIIVISGMPIRVDIERL